MDVLKAQLERIQRQLAGLSATQKMLTAALVAIMAITVVWWGKYAGESEMVPLTSQTLTQAELGKMDDKLSDKGYRHTVSADKILVPSEQRVQILSYLIYSKAMPRGTGQAMDEILKQRNVFDSADTTERIWNRGKEALLGEMVRTFPDVDDATVIVSPISQYRVGANIDPSATVNVTTAPGAGKPQWIADAAAAAVSGAQAGLTRKNIKVVINGKPQHVSDPDSNDALVDANDQLMTLQLWESRAEERIRNVFGIEGLLVSVAMTMNNTSIVKEQTEYDAKGVVQKELQSNSDTEETNSSAPPAGGEAATVPNTSVNANGSGASSGQTQSQTREKSDQKYDVRIPETKTHSKTPSGGVVAQGATVRVPLSYFARVLKGTDPAIKEPTRKQLDPVIAAELPLMKQQAALAAGLTSPDLVAISAYVDPAPPASMQLSGPSSTVGTGMVSVLVGGHAKEIALGALALMSLFMASMMVRKGQPSPVPAPAAIQAPGPLPTPVLLAGEPIAGEAASGDTLLDGMELNEEAIKAQQMVDQVSTMVRENPDAAATLVKRWLNRT